MRRMTAALLLSVLIHFALLGRFSWQVPEPAVREIARVSLSSLPRKTEAATPAASGALLRAAAPVPPKPAQPPPKKTKEGAAQAPVKTERRVRLPKTPPPVEPQPKHERTDAPPAPASQTDVPVAAGAGTASDAAPAGGGSKRGALDASPPGPHATGSAPGAVIDAEDLRVLKKRTPDYPMISRKRREQGTVVLLIRIESGKVVEVEVERGSGHGMLDESAVRAVREWRFDTAGYGGRITARIPFSFTLQ